MAVVGFNPHAHSVGVLAEGTFSHLIQRLGPTKEVMAQRARQPDYNALTLSLSHRSLTVGLLDSPWPENGPSLRRRNSNIPIGHRVVDQSHAIS